MPRIIDEEEVTSLDGTYYLAAFSQTGSKRILPGNLPFTAAGAGAVARTVQAKAREIVSVTDFYANGVSGVGVDITGVVDSTLGCQAALNSLPIDGALFIPDTGAGFIKISSALVLPSLNGIAMYGAGKRTSRIGQITAGTDAIQTANATNNGVVIRDLWLEAQVSTARYGIVWGTNTNGCNRSQLLNVRVSGFKGGAGIWTESSISCDMQGCDFDGNLDGILQTGSGVSAPNGWNISGCTFENQTQYGLNLYAMNGSAFTGNSVEANAKGGLRFTTVASGVNISGNYFEENRDAAPSANAFDIYIGTNSICRAITVKGNYFNGHATDTGYYPIRMKYAAACEIGPNELNVGSRFVSFTSGASVTNCAFGEIDFRTGTPDRSQGTGATYGGVPPEFIAFGNSIEDNATFGILVNENFVTTDFPTGWTATLSGSSTWMRSPGTGTTPDSFNGRPVGMLTKNGGSAILTKSLTVSATQNSAVRNNFVTFVIDYYVNNAASKAFGLGIDDNPGSQGTTVSWTGSTTTGWQTASVSGYFTSATTAIRALINTTNDAEFRFANPRWYIGLGKVIQGMSGTVTFIDSAAPTSGTWTVGDMVWNSGVAAGGTPGWVCTTAGTGGGALVFKAMANVAA